MKRQSKPSRDSTGIDAGFIIMPLLIGIAGSILLVLSYAALELAWLGPIVYNEGLKNVYLLQWALLIFLIPVFTGALAAMAVAPRVKRYTYAIAAGMLAGILTGPGFAAVLTLFVMTLNFTRTGLLGWQSIHDTIFPLLAGSIQSLVDDPIYACAFILLSIMLSAVGGSALYAVSYYARAKKSRAPGISGRSSIKIIASAAAILLALAIVPPAAAFAGAQTGLLGPQGFHPVITAERLAGDSIKLTNAGGDALSGLDTTKPFHVYVGSSLGGYDMTNQTAAAGLNVTLDPPEGLGYAPGSTLTITGKGIQDLAYVDQATGKTVTHVMVIGTMQDGQAFIFLEKAL